MDTYTYKALLVGLFIYIHVQVHVHPQERVLKKRQKKTKKEWDMVST